VVLGRSDQTIQNRNWDTLDYLNAPFSWLSGTELRRRTAGLVTVLTVLTVLTLVSGCEAGTVAEPGDDVHPERQAQADLLSRPDVDTALTDLERMLDEMQAGLRSELGLDGWQRTGEGGASGCGEFRGAGGQKRTTLTWMRPGGIPDELWPRTVQVFGEVSARYGFGPQQVDLPGGTTSAPSAPYGAYYNLANNLANEANAAMYATTGCHPNAPAKATATAAPAG
jgi:hypothetical protein